MSYSEGPHERDLEAGKLAKEIGMARVTNATPEEWKRAFDIQLKLCAVSGVPFTSENITRVIGLPPSVNAVGARMNAAAKRGLIKRIGFTQAKRAERQAAMVSVWQGV